MRTRRPLLPVLVVCLLGAAASAQADQIILDATKDNTLFSESDDLSNGSGARLFVGRTNNGALRRALVAFGVAGSIPAGSTINSVSLQLTMSRTQAGPQPAALHRVLADWGEGASNAPGQEGDGDNAEDNDATWAYRFYVAANPTGSPAWSSPGGDFNPSASASLSVDATGIYTWLSTPALVADVQAWLDTPSSNFGWILIGNEGSNQTAKRFDSSENNSEPARPKLTVDFTLPSASGACCADDASCTDVPAASCTGLFLGTGVACTPTNPCPSQTGACCATDGSCTLVLDPGGSCGGTYQGSGSVCDPNTCPPPPTGACCSTDFLDPNTPVADPNDPNSLCLERTQAQCTALGRTYQGDGSVCSIEACPVLLEPFVDALPLPAVATPVSGTSGGVASYDIAMREIQQKLHRDLPATTLWGYGDGPTGATYPGPTIEASTDQQVTVTWINDLRDPNGVLRTQHFLPVDNCPHGAEDPNDPPRTVVHLHGAHVAAEFDGYPEDTFLPGQQAVYQYPNGQLPSTLWYHDHALGITRLNVYMGLAGFYLIRDAFEQALNLPSGEFEIPVAIQDRTFKADGSLSYPVGLQDTFFGDTMLVNGKVWPFLNVKQGKYRLRLLNGCNSRTLRLAFRDPNGPIAVDQIGIEGGLIAAPVNLSEINLGPAERADVIVDFAPYAAGTELLLVNSAPAPFPGDPNVGVIPDVMKFIVTAQAGDTDPVPATLRTLEVLDPNDSVISRDFNLKKGGGDACSDFIWQINGLHWEDITEYPELDTVEIWRFINKSGMTHPMHMHLVMFQVLDRQAFEQDPNDPNGIIPLGAPVPAPPHETGWKDTVQVGPNEMVRVIARFESYAGKFSYHCHILEHEDHEMMRQFWTVSCGNGALEPTEECDDGAKVDGDGCSAACLNEDFLNLFGLAQGGTVELRVDGTLIVTTTTSGQTPEQVAAAVAADINADPTLSAAGVTAFAQGAQVVTIGTITDVNITDPGLSEQPIPVNALSGWGAACLAALLILAALILVRRLPARA